jgi:Cdc6-like AAA superfamily ATPase
MKFSQIVPASSAQPSVFSLMADSINSFLKGINNTIFAYGQTGAGKTYTITGDCPENINSVEAAVVSDKLRN